MAATPKAKPIYPMVIVLASISLIEVAVTFLYPRLTAAWERIPILALIVTIPLAVVGGFIYVWIKKPGHLYPPSEFSGAEISRKLEAYCPTCGIERPTRSDRSTMTR